MKGVEQPGILRAQTFVAFHQRAETQVVFLVSHQLSYAHTIPYLLERQACSSRCVTLPYEVHESFIEPENKLHESKII